MIQVNKISGKRAIAIFDILGFRELVNTAELSKLPEIVKKTLILSRNPLISRNLVGSIVFSDTIVLYGLAGKNIYDESWIIVSSSNLLHMSARFGIPIRGALTFGEIFINQKERTIIGPALVKGYDLEQNQNWMGAIIDPDCEDRFKLGLFNLPNKLHNNIIKYPAPLKSGLRKDYSCIGWLHRFNPSEDELNNVFIKGNKKVQHSIYQKYLNTVEFLRYCKINYSSDF
jgi:hypothetical protein